MYSASGVLAAQNINSNSGLDGNALAWFRLHGGGLEQLTLCIGPRIYT
jgi:hypothetical protein